MMGHTTLNEDYEVDQRAVIGRGRFSTVKLAFSRRHGRHVAAKITPLSRENDDPISNASQEFQILSRLDHGNIIDVYDHFVEAGSLWIFMEHAQNGDLRKFVHLRRRLSIKLARKFFRQILDAVAYMHSQDVVHRDIKCENILVTGDEGIVKLCDMGCAVSLTERTESDPPSQHREGIYGSPAYAAPEVLDRTARGLKPADVWSTGVVMFFMVCGYLPFGCDDVPRIRARMTSPLRWPRPLRQIDKDCREYVESILQLRPEDRPTAADALRGTWMKKN
ncbi:testis-specific serine/threonine-protein kinase 3-like [Patiria miniata]|uniref:Protein kinase domain-containing protein n=1 Tax=Patiria miniata TaxID=46514 RepID=A0A913ZDV5_PATMI|nr:testis-specific serine/threonine-protein kinase 3-like [Patiria miniata]